MTGSYPNPTVAAGAITSAKIAANTITDSNVASANKDGTAGTASLRTLGTGATQAAAGNHTHTGVYEPANSNIQSHIADSGIHVSSSEKSALAGTSGTPGALNKYVTDSDL